MHKNVLLILLYYRRFAAQGFHTYCTFRGWYPYTHGEVYSWVFFLVSVFLCKGTFVGRTAAKAHSIAYALTFDVVVAVGF